MIKKYIIILSKDSVMKKLIAAYGEIDLGSEKRDIFEDLIRAIINQQLSDKVADTITNRFVNLFKLKSFPKPEEILKRSDEDLRNIGISYSKVSYIKGVSQTVVDNKIDFSNFSEMSDQEVFETVTQLKGVGPWTAEMLLMNTLKRPDIFSIGDVALRNAVSKLYHVKRDDIKEIIKFSLNWKPFRSYASRYLWKSLE